MEFYNTSLEKLYTNLNSNENGLNNSSVKINRDKFGTNELQAQKKTSFISRFFAQFKNIMIIVLLVSAVISTIISLAKHEYGDLFEGGLIFLIVIMNSLIGALQEKRAENALELLNKKTEPLAKVKRNGKFIKIPTTEVVVGDIVSLSAGDFVPADIRLISSTNLKCDESTLTGESHAVFKNAEKQIPQNTPLAEQENMCFSGTTCTYGHATGIVVRVGKDTEIGKIAKMLSNNKREKTPLEKNIDKIGKLITYGVLIIVAIVFIIQLIFSRQTNVLEAFLIAIALAVAAIPESLPAVITIVMALGVERIAKQRAIVKTLSSTETLGCCNVICSDKTGTLTQNKMTINHIYFNKQMIDNFNNGKDLEILYRAMALCNNAKISNETIIGDATESSMIAHIKKYNPDILADALKYERIKEIPFDSSRKIMSTINNVDGNYILFSKGAYDYLISKCSYILVSGEQKPLTPILKSEIEKAINLMTDQAERVLAVTYKNIDNNVSTSEHDLTFIGLVGIIDPPRPEAKSAIKQCHKSGLKPVMITGDHPDTAFAIAKELGIAKKKDEVVTGSQIDHLSVSSLSKVIENYSVFARVTPEHKVKIVKAFKKIGKIVAMTGDGVNDAPSIKEANIGTCMGISGTDVTKSVADLIITDDNFETIVVAIKEGRTIYNNIQKIILFLLSTNLVEVLGIFVATIIMRDQIFLSPAQILFINLVTDSFPAFALGLEPSEKDIMQKPPRNTSDSLFSGRVGTSILYQSFVQTLLVLVIFVIGVHKWGNAVASTMVFLIICLMQIIHAINCKTLDSIFKINIFSNKSFNISFLGLLALILIVAFVPILQTAFGIVALSFTQWLIVAIASISIIPLVEICKYFVNKWYQKNDLKSI